MRTSLGAVGMSSLPSAGKSGVRPRVHNRTVTRGRVLVREIEVKALGRQPFARRQLSIELPAAAHIMPGRQNEQLPGSLASEMAPMQAQELRLMQEKDERFHCTPV